MFCLAAESLCLRDKGEWWGVVLILDISPLHTCVTMVTAYQRVCYYGNCLSAPYQRVCYYGNSLSARFRLTTNTSSDLQITLP